jgi:hypothetical protein
MRDESPDQIIEVNGADDIVAAREAGHRLASELGFSLLFDRPRPRTRAAHRPHPDGPADRGLGAGARDHGRDVEVDSGVIANGTSGEHTRVTYDALVPAARFTGPT